MSDDATVPTTAGAFSLVGNEHRVAILEALLGLHREGEGYPASFSRLREATGMEVSAQFSYHLGELTGHFLRETDDGYEFRYAGWTVATAILAGTYDRGDRFEATGIDGTCPLCGAEALTASYVEEWLAVACSACGERLTRYPLPPGALSDRSPPEFLRAFDRYVRAHVGLARDGVCPACTGSMRPVVGDDERTAGRIAGYWCERCGNRLHPAPGMAPLEAPAVRSFYRERGRQVDEDPYWEYRPCVDDNLAEVVGTDPWRARVRFPVEGDTLVVELDGDLAVAATTIESG